MNGWINESQERYLLTKGEEVGDAGAGEVTSRGCWLICKMRLDSGFSFMDSVSLCGAVL